MGINEIHNLNHAQSFGAGHAARQRTKEEIQGFEELIQEKAGDRLNFSKHAAKRLGERGIAIDNQLLGDLEHAVDEARKKGSRDVAVIGSQGMFIVNIPNNTVVTTMSQDAFSSEQIRCNWQQYCKCQHPWIQGTELQLQRGHVPDLRGFHRRYGFRSG